MPENNLLKTPPYKVPNNTLHIMTLESLGSTLKVKAVVQNEIQKKVSETALSARMKEGNRIHIKAVTQDRLKGGASIKAAVIQRTGNNMAVKGER